MDNVWSEISSARTKCCLPSGELGRKSPALSAPLHPPLQADPMFKLEVGCELGITDLVLPSLSRGGQEGERGHRSVIWR